MPTYNNFTTEMKHVMAAAHDHAADRGRSYVEPIHLLMGLIQVDSIAAIVLKRLGISMESIKRVDTNMTGAREGDLLKGQATFTLRSRRIVGESLRQANSLSHGYVGPAHLLLALIDMRDLLIDILLKSYKLKPADVRRGVMDDMREQARLVS